MIKVLLVDHELLQASQLIPKIVERLAIWHNSRLVQEHHLQFS